MLPIVPQWTETVRFRWIRRSSIAAGGDVTLGVVPHVGARIAADGGDRVKTSARAEVTAFGAERLCDEQSFVRSAGLWCITVPSGAGKTEIPA